MEYLRTACLTALTNALPYRVDCEDLEEEENGRIRLTINHVQYEIEVSVKAVEKED